MATSNTPETGTVIQQSEDEKSILKGFFPSYQRGINSIEAGTAWKDTYEPIIEKPFGIIYSTSLSFGYSLSDVTTIANLANQLLKELNTSSPGQSSCKIPDQIFEKDSPVKTPETDVTTLCWRKSPLLKSITDAKDTDNPKDNPVALIQNIFNVITELNKPADPAECINPYFDQFFNVIPLQFIITKFIKDKLREALGSLTDQKVEDQLNQLACGSELTKMYTNSLDVPNIPFPLFKLPPIPTIPNINIYRVFDRILVEAVCYAVCLVLTEIIVWATDVMSKWLNEWMSESTMGAGSYTEFQNGLIKKIDLNKKVVDRFLEQAIIQGKVANYKDLIKDKIGDPPEKQKIRKDGLWRDPTEEEVKLVILELKKNIRQYFKAIYDYVSPEFKKKVYNPSKKMYEEQITTRELGTKEIAFLIMGEYNCFTMEDLKTIGARPEFTSLQLETEQRIKTFFTFIGSNIDVLEMVTSLKKEGCPADPCEEEVLDGIKEKLSGLCDIINVQKSGIPPIPINQILKSVGMDQLFNKGIKDQFTQLKTEQLLFLGFPSMQNFPTIQDIERFPPNTFHPGSYLNDYDLWNYKTIQDETLFRNYFLRGKSFLYWKYDDVNLNQNLVGSTLEDVCSGEEPFEETLSYVFNDIFNQDLNKIVKFSSYQKNEYKNIFETKVKEVYNRPSK